MKDMARDMDIVQHHIQLDMVYIWQFVISQFIFFK